MTDEKWQDTVGRIKDSFQVLEEKLESAPEQGIKSREWIIFQSPLGKMKLERLVRFHVLDKKTIGSKRICGETAVEYVYSSEETFQKVFAYKWNEEKSMWEEMSGEGIL